MSDFVHLHLHSEYSLLDGACRIKEIPKRAKECGHKAVALTDHGVMYGAVAFYRACKEEGVQPIIGCEVYVAPRSRFEKGSSDAHPNHLILLCQNEIGYKNLIDIVSRSFIEGFYNKPRVDIQLLKEKNEGLIALSACLAGRIPQLLLAGDMESAVKTANELADIFKNRFYIELQNHGLPEQKQILPMLFELAQRCRLPVVATNDCHYLRKTDAELQSVLLCIQTNARLADGRPFGFETDEFYYKTTEEMEKLFSAYEGALENTVKIAERCNFDFDFSKIYLPKFPCPMGKTAAVYLRELTEIGFENRVNCGLIDFNLHAKEEYEKRMAYELSVINTMGYDDYFLIVQDYVNFAKSKKIPVGPGRGSGAGSVVAYFLGITDVDPLVFDLLFERFLNPERVSMPDIDMDFCYNRRDEVIRYVGERYGQDHVSQIITFGTLAARAAVRDVGRALGMPYNEVDAVAKAIPRELGITIADALKLPDLKALYQGDVNVRRLVDYAKALEGMPRNVSIHAAGIVITAQPVSSYVPLANSNGAVITQYDMDTVAKLGLLKFDFLALRYLTIINDAVLQIKEKNPGFDIEKIPLDDAATYKLCAKGATSGVFQLESAGIRQVLVNLSPDRFDDIVATIALYRPGPMDSIPTFIENRKHPEKVNYKLPQLEPILRSTYGCVVYQEQVMEIFRQLAGFTFGHADIVRRAMSKKKAEALEAERGAFLDGCEKNHIDRAAANALFDELSTFANYAFNKSHAAAYAVICYRTAYLKEHYPKEYFAALLTSELGNMPKIAEYIAEVSKRGVRVLPPDINESNAVFHVSGDHIRFGLLALKNVGRVFLDNAVSERRTGGPYRSFDDFLDRMTSHDLNKRQVEALIKAGAFDNLGIYRSRLLAVYEGMIDKLQSKNRSNLTGQLDMFSLPGIDRPDVAYPDIPEFSLRDLLMQEKEAAGMYFSGHLLDGFTESLAAPDISSIHELYAQDSEGEWLHTDREKAVIAGIITAISGKTTKNDERMAFFTLEDRLDEMECVVFPKVFEQNSSLLHRDSAVRAEGYLNIRDEEKPKLILQRILPLKENGKAEKAPVATPIKEKTREEKPADSFVFPQNPHILYLRVPKMEGTTFEKVKNLIDIFEGNCQVSVYSAADGKYHPLEEGFDATPYTVKELSLLLGTENVVLK